MANSLINKSAVRKYTLGVAGQTRHHPFTRLDPAVFDTVEGMVRNYLHNLVQKQPSSGKTIRP
jgi:hypothetical protein